MRIEDTAHILVFAVGEAIHALPLAGVEKVEFAVEVAPFPDAPHVFIGAIDWKGLILPVMSMRRRLHLPERGVRASDRIIIVKTSRRRLALLVDEVVGIRPCRAGDVTSAYSLSDGLGCVAGATRAADGIVLIHDLEQFLSEADEKALAAL
jgi:purine-binding chemotaxis protein CheW